MNDIFSNRLNNCSSPTDYVCDDNYFSIDMNALTGNTKANKMAKADYILYSNLLHARLSV